jgi:integrase
MSSEWSSIGSTLAEDVTLLTVLPRLRTNNPKGLGATLTIVCALRFYYGVTLGEAFIPERIPYAREPRRLPVVLSADEVVQFLEAVSSLKSRAALTTAYAAGLRASEVARMRIEDIDSARGVIQVATAKARRIAM